MLLDEFSDKQLDFFKNANSRLNFAVGSVRSGKTYITILKFLKHVREIDYHDFILSGKTEGTITRNIVSPLKILLGKEVRHIKGQSPRLELWNKTIHIISANDHSAEGKLRGMTAAGAYIDEVTLLPENFYNMLLSRLSVTGSKLYGATNPDSPYHWFKAKFLDREKDLDLKQWHFDLNDNPSLSQEYKDNLKREYTGLWYKRFIDGDWVLAEGAIFDFFDEAYHTIEWKPSDATYYIAGIDYGTTNPCVFVLVGVNRSSYPNMWVEKEYYWDSRKQNKQKTDYDYARDFMDFIKGYRVDVAYLDPSAASFQVELGRAGFDRVSHADNDVISGIRFVTQLFNNGTVKILKHCRNLISEMGTYVWDEKAAMRGEDKPKKENDHAIDAMRYALFTHFFKEDLAEESKGRIEEAWREVTNQHHDLPGPFQSPNHFGGYRF